MISDIFSYFDDMCFLHNILSKLLFVSVKIFQKNTLNIVFIKDTSCIFGSFYWLNKVHVNFKKFSYIFIWFLRPYLCSKNTTEKLFWTKKATKQNFLNKLTSQKTAFLEYLKIYRVTSWSKSGIKNNPNVFWDSWNINPH